MLRNSIRQSPLVRSHRRYPLSMIEHGQLVLQLLTSVRFATGNQIERALFSHDSSSTRMARHRATRSVRRLFDSGLVRRVSVFAPSSTGRMSRQIVNVLSASGAGVVGVNPDWARRRAPRQDAILVHDAWLVEVAVRAMEGCPAMLAITTWWDDRVLAGRKRHGRLSLPTIPDGFLVVENLSTGKLYPALVELDLGTETVMGPSYGRRDVRQKIEGYLVYLETEFRRDFEIDAPPIVLIITDSQRRLTSLRELTYQLGGGGRFWFSTLAHLRGNAVANPHQDTRSAARQAPFWASNWQTAHEEGWRSLATRCAA